MSKILIVDDKEMMRDSVAATLARKGHVVTTAPGGKAAWKRPSSWSEVSSTTSRCNRMRCISAP